MLLLVKKLKNKNNTPCRGRYLSLGHTKLRNFSRRHVGIGGFGVIGAIGGFVGHKKTAPRDARRLSHKIFSLPWQTLCQLLGLGAAHEDGKFRYRNAQIIRGLINRHMLVLTQPKHIPDPVNEPLAGAFAQTSNLLKIRRINS
ncbi:hypothetical protein [Parapedobacter sp.]